MAEEYAPPPPGVPVSAAESATGALGAETIAAFMHSFHRDGFAVLLGALPMDTMHELKQQLDHSCAVEIQRNGTKEGGFMQNGLPRAAPYITAKLVANPIVEQIVAAILGEGPFLSYCAGNTNTPQEGEDPGDQKFHMDGIWAWATHEAAAAAGQPWPLQSNSCVVNIMPQEDTASNATEIWPGFRARQIGGSGGSLETPGRLLSHLHIVHMEVLTPLGPF